MSAPNIHIKTASGYVDINGIASSNINVVTASGNINVGNSNVNGSLTIKSASGNITVADCTFLDAEIKTASGSGTVNLTDNATRYDISVTPGTINNGGASRVVYPSLTYNWKRVSVNHLQNSSAEIPIRLSGTTGSFNVNDN
jgi:DUF4097 and DUF4098 domain-containing protein YvlB